MIIQENKKLQLHNLMSYRKKINSLDVDGMVKKIKEEYKDIIDFKDNLMVTITHYFNGDRNNPELDVEVMFPVKNNKEIHYPLTYKKNFILENAAYGGMMNDFSEVTDVATILSEIVIKNRAKAGINVWVQYTIKDDSFLDLYVELAN